MDKEYNCTILTISNVKSTVDRFKNDLQKQTGVNVQLIVIENYNQDYLGARQAFNAHLSEIKNDNVLFMHPDIVFLNKTALFSILQQAEAIENYGVIGIAGCPPGKKWLIVSTMVHGKQKVQCGVTFDTPVEVQTVDECLFLMKRSTIDKWRFSDITGWHLYAVEQCLRMNQAGLKNYVVPCQVHHFSAGNSLDPSYVKILIIIKQMYASLPHYLNTTVKQWRTSSAEGNMYIYYYYLKMWLKKILKNGK